MKKSTLIVATAAVITTITGSSAQAGLITTFDFNVSTTDTVATMTHNGSHTMGTAQSAILPTEVYFAPIPTLDLNSTMPQGTAINNVVAFDFSAMLGQYGGSLSGTTSSLMMQNIKNSAGDPVSVQPGTVQVFSDASLTTAVTPNMIFEPGVNQFAVSWNNADLNPTNPTIFVTWNSVPTPGPLALLSVAGILAGGRRRRG